MKEKFYLTTPIYYVNDVPHIGHAYTTIAGDVLARYKRLQGFDVHYLTGTDEHGQKIWRAGGMNDAGAKKLVDEKVAGFKEAWKVLNISYDDFLRTTEKRHEKVVQAFFSQMLANGDVYKGEYEGHYCVPCESFWSNSELKEDDKGRKLCPDCSRETELLKEATYFFKLSKYEKPLLAHIEKHPEFIQPESRRNEILQFIKSSLRDLSVTRTAFPWGIPIPGDPKHVIYVWFDALINYVSAPGYPDSENYKKYWPADVHLMGKEIVRFHSVIWPAMLMSLNIPLPKVVFGHGWWTVEGKKMSKSKGNVVDPIALSKEFGVDAVRYFLMREVPFGGDGDFSRTSFIKRYNSDLANDIGNLLNRTLTMVGKYFDGVIPNPPDKADDLAERAEATNGLIRTHMNDLRFSQALEQIWETINQANKYIEDKAPWKLDKAGKTKELEEVMYNLCRVLSVSAVLISPFMPETAQKMWQQLGLKDKISLDAKIAGVKINKGEPLFPRIQT
ncbi:MAG: methionine--tRNA ligase [bacterium]